MHVTINALSAFAYGLWHAQIDHRASIALYSLVKSGGSRFGRKDLTGPVNRIMGNLTDPCIEFCMNAAMGTQIIEVAAGNGNTKHFLKADGLGAKLNPVAMCFFVLSTFEFHGICIRDTTSRVQVQFNKITFAD